MGGTAGWLGPGGSTCTITSQSHAYAKPKHRHIGKALLCGRTRVGMLADLGVTFNSSVTYQHLVAHNPDFAMFMGDLSYADDW